MKKVGVVSLGCSKNLVDAEMMMGLLADAGWELIDDMSQADIIVVNTCTFIEAAKEESIEVILQAAKYKETGHCQMLVVTGCLSQQFKDELFAEIPEIDVLLGTESWQRIVEAVERAEKERQVKYFDRPKQPCFDDIPRERTTPYYSAYVKIAEGCSNGCTFCIIPYVRGPFRSREMDSIEAEVRQMAAEGVTEINVIAQDTTSYGRDLAEPKTLVDLLKRLVSIDGIRWIRLLYLYPKYFSDELLDFIVTEDKMCKYIDIPLQHISDRILRQMNRKDRKADILMLLKKIRAATTHVTLRTTFIVGFPGETDADFAELCDLVKTIRFDRVGVFTYSAEDGTPAARMEDQVLPEVKEDRYHQLMAIQAQISEEINRQRVGQCTEALVEDIQETESGAIAVGRLVDQAPEVDGQVYIEDGGNLAPGYFVPVRITAGYAYDVTAVCDVGEG